MNTHCHIRLVLHLSPDSPHYRIIMSSEIEVQDAAGVPIHAQMRVDGMRINDFSKPAEVTTSIIRNIKHLKMRDDDVMLCTPSKSGTHWAFEILTMLLGNKAEISPLHKTFTMLVNCPEETLDTFPSPRLLNTHFPFYMLPEQLTEKKNKIVVVLRNPKDVVVSMYYHHKGMRMFHYNGKFSDYLPLFMDGNLEYNSWFDYVLEIEKTAAAEPDPIRIVFYEDLKENGVEEIRKLAAFLNLPAADDIQLCKEIDETCGFTSMKKNKIMDPKIVKFVFKDDFTILRKGQIGDWKNHFTVAENETFDNLFAEKMAGSKLKFKFEPEK